MALTVGELTGLISLNDDGVAPALRRTEGAMRSSGQRLASDADNAGQQAGRQLGEGLVRGADGQWRNMRGDLVDAVTAAAADAEAAAHRAGQRAGQQLGDGLTDGAQQGGEDAAQAAEGGLSRLQLAAAGLGAAAGAVLMDAMGQAMEQSQISGRLAAQLGATPAEAEKYGKLAGKLYADAVTVDFQSAADTISAVMRAGIAPPDATEAQLESIATKVSDLSSTFELDLGQTANAVGQMLKTGLAKNGGEAVDVLTAGLQRMGPRADDIADTFNEYSTIFRQMGVDATQATGLLSQGMQAGARDTDVVADALKEFVLITQGGGDEVDAAFKKIGLSGAEMQKAFTEGGPEARKALDKVFDGLRKVKDPAERSALAVQLFGTKAEDTQKALFSLDPSKAADALGKVGGKADEMGNRLRDNSGAKLEAFKRGMQQNLVEFLGGEVLPRLEGFFSFMGDNKGLVLGLAGAVLVLGSAFAIASIGVWAMNSAMLANPMFWIIAGVVALIAGAVALIVLYWDDIVAATSAAWEWVVMKVRWAKAMVLAAIAYLGTIPGKVAGWWKSVKDRTVQIVTAWVSWVRGIPGRVWSAISGLAGRLRTASNNAWTSFRNAAAVKIVSFISYVRGIPGRVARAIGSVSNLLYSKGRNIVTGLWNGIVGMGGWLRSKIMGWARSVIPGPVAKALGISSPSKVMAKQVGRWIPRGIVAGIESTAGEVDRTMENLVRTPTPSASYAGAVGSAMSAGASSGQRSPKTVQLTGGDEFGRYVIEKLRKQVDILGGDVQFALGTR